MTGTGEGRQRLPATAALIFGAFVWGVIWYPYRLLFENGLGGIGASLLTYLVALVLGVLVLGAKLRGVRPTGLLVAIGLTAGGCNLGYVLATLHGEIMRVLLLFYLAPLWTVLLARGLLGERLDRSGRIVVTLSLVGAATMLWHPAMGAPWPRVGAEWLGLGAGFLFALSNVLIRRADDLSIELKSFAVCVGVVLIAVVLLAAGLEPLPAAPAVLAGRGPGLVLLLGALLLLVNLVVQYGLMRIPANRAIVILLSELVFAALSSWWLAGEMMGLRDWIGGSMIIAASLISARLAGTGDRAVA